METLADSIGAFGSTLFRWSVVGLVLVNGLAVAVFAASRSRAVVNRWTSRLVATNLLLLATGLGVPAVTMAMRLVVKAVTASQGTQIQLKSK
jgi:hypothetical protein